MTSRSIASTLILILLSASTPVVALTQTLTGRVVSVGDGDTLRVATGGKTVTVRLACIDAAETTQAPFGKAAADRLRQLLPPGQQVTLRVADTDRYGRSVAKVYKGDLSINLVLVQEGQAVVYREYLNACPELKKRLLNAEANAKSRKLGFWNQASPILPADFRRGKKATSLTKPAASGVRHPVGEIRGRDHRSSSSPARDDYNCRDFKTQAESQRVLNSTPGKDPYNLDSDGDHIACESLL